jgi:NAD(P)-dependent dehydrogenase (short-subunit alcohol dehydrogenase family)
LTRAYALRLATSGVTVNAMAPGLVDTDIGKPLIEAGVVNRIPAGSRRVRQSPSMAAHCFPESFREIREPGNTWGYPLAILILKTSPLLPRALLSWLFLL